MANAPATEGQAPPAAETPPTTQTPSNPPDSADQTPTEKEWDEELGRPLVQKLRLAVKDSEKRTKGLEQEVAAYKKQEEEAKRAQLSEQERLKADLEAQKAETKREQASRREAVNRLTVQVQAQRLGIIDPDAAEKLLDWSLVEYGDDGRPTNVDEVLTALVADRPYLKAPPTQQQTPTLQPTNPATHQNVPGQRQYTQAEVADYRFYTAHRDDIIAAHREGRIRAG